MRILPRYWHETQRENAGKYIKSMAVVQCSFIPLQSNAFIIPGHVASSNEIVERGQGGSLGGAKCAKTKPATTTSLSAVSKGLGLSQMFFTEDTKERSEMLDQLGEQMR